jgi:1-acyl-sn-glycerol-3-phosphate acyltransferase
MWSRWLGVGLAKGLWATEVRGKEKVPSSGPVIVVANHLGFIDGPVMHGVIPRGSHFLISDHMYKGAVKPLMHLAGQIKVEGSGRAALAKGRAVLKRGGVVGVFPEGTRGTGAADSVHGGAAWLAIQTGAPIVPTALIGTRNTGEGVNVWPRPRRRILVEFGDAVVLEPPAELKGRAKQTWAEHAVAEALRKQVGAALTTTDLELPTDTPERKPRKGSAGIEPKENA